jgi:transposase-like protein
MPQAWLPLIPSGATPINDVVSVTLDGEQWRYFCGINPVFVHHKDDGRSFRMYTAQLVCEGMCKASQVVAVFGVTPKSVGRSVEKYQQGGVGAFFEPRKGRGGTVFTAEVIAHAQALLNQGESRQDVARELGVKEDTLRKAINQGRLSEPVRLASVAVASDKSTRTQQDAAAPLGHACTRPGERVAAALGLLTEGAAVRFLPCHDVTFGGVLCALPALIASGLLSHVDGCFKQLRGYYTTVHILLLLAQMALCRIKTVEQLQGYAPGELGKLMGLDRIPEVRCLRKKIAALSQDDAPEVWSGLLSRDWMESAPELCGALYVDGHVRVYHGRKTALPKRFVSRERLCLRGTTDYWVNDALGQPYFVVNRPVDQGMLEALRSDIVPKLLKDVPEQPSEAALSQDSYRHRFIMIFDREGYSPGFFKQMWVDHRIACITYHKFPKEVWPEEEFVTTEVTMPGGERLKLKLAERGSYIGDKKQGVWVREVRKLSQNGHQTSLISTAKQHISAEDAALIFSRWSQENFFAYMKKHYAIDVLSEYGTEGFPGRQPVINPAWRELDRKQRSLKAKYTHHAACYAALELHPESDEKKVAHWKRKKAEFVEAIEHIEHALEEVKETLAQTSKHLDWSELPAEDKFEQLKPSRKRLVDTIKMIAYRAETALVNIVREELARHDDARALIQTLCQSEADILPDKDAQTLTIQVHRMPNARSDRALAHLFEHLNEAAYNYPGTNLRMVFRLAVAPALSPTT